MFHNGTISIVNDREDTVEISPKETLIVAEVMDRDNLWENFRANESFMRLFRFVFPDESVVPERNASTGVRHVSGMIVMLSGTIRKGLRPFLRLPESYLHPKAQLGLADMLISLSKSSI